MTARTAFSPLRLDRRGIWRAQEGPPISYPADAHAVCLELERESFWFRHRQRVLLDAVRRYPPAGPVFDVGGGNGAFAVALQDAGFEAVLVNPDPGGALAGKRRGVEKVIQGQFELCGFPENALPAVGLFDVLEHVDDDAGLLVSIHRSMVAGGFLYLTVPAYSALWSHYDVRVHHRRRYRLAHLSALIEGAGFRLEQVSYFFAPLVVPAWLLRALPYRLGLVREASVESFRQQMHPPIRPLRALLDAVLRPELAWLDTGRSVPFGTSCLAVARKD